MCRPCVPFSGLVKVFRIVQVCKSVETVILGGLNAVVSASSNKSESKGSQILRLAGLRAFEENVGQTASADCLTQQFAFADTTVTVDHSERIGRSFEKPGLALALPDVQ